MAPLSILPGRIRFESRSLIGKHEQCLQLEQLLRSWSEVQDVLANHRTGRVLVRFDEEAISREDLTKEISELLATGKCFRQAPEPATSALSQDQPARPVRSGHLTRHLLRDMVAHAILPAPLDLLVPTALAALRR